MANSPSSSLKQPREYFKTVLYFIYGLLAFPTFLISFIVASLWLKFKAKTNRRRKFIALLIGFIAPLLLSLIFNISFIRDAAKQWVYSKAPEMKVVDTALAQKYPNANISLSTEYNTTYVSGQSPVSSSRFFVTYESSDNMLSRPEMADMGKLVCNTLNSINKPYDYVSISSKKSLRILIPLPFYTTFTERASCKEWLGGRSSE